MSQRMTGCELFKEHYESFVLGMLEGEERAGIQDHLDEGCAVCLAQVRQATELVACVAWLAPVRQPPAALRRKLLQTVQAQQPKRAWLPLSTWAAIAAMLILGALAVVEFRERHRAIAQLDALDRELTARNENYLRALTIVGTAGTRTISLTPTAPAAPKVNAYWNEIAGLLLTGRGMPAPTTGRTYQLWVVPKKGIPISAGIFDPDAQGRALLISQPQATQANAAALAITQEPAGGVPQPTSKPIWVGPIG
jgi:anti-sigma-K factor RskA